MHIPGFIFFCDAGMRNRRREYLTDTQENQSRMKKEGGWPLLKIPSNGDFQCYFHKEGVCYLYMFLLVSGTALKSNF